ncbi:hypothetical protein Adt_39705 [Abeliophyllum distichum]|uniref:Uncharacterized protein n=1 Tax=Abeliophyllum distichum TaxID=126358 RepID=A0ABD1Q6T6_9LAMI
MQKHIWAKRKVLLTDFPYSEMANLIHYCGWQRVACKPHLTYPLLVKEFLANFNHAIGEPEADHRYTTWVCGKWIKFSPAVIVNYYGLRANDIEPIPADFDMTQTLRNLGPSFFIILQVGTKLTWGITSSDSLLISRHSVRLADLSMFRCLISALCLVDGVPLLPHEEPESPKQPITKWTLSNPVARRVADNPAPIPAAETDRLLHQIFTQLSQLGWVLNSIQRTQLAM